MKATNVPPKTTNCCAGPAYPTAFGRRSFIQVGLLGGLGLSMADLFKVKALASVVRPGNGDVALHQRRSGEERGSKSSCRAALLIRSLGTRSPRLLSSIEGPSASPRPRFRALSLARTWRAPRRLPTKSP